MAEKGLSESESTVLYGLVRNPLLNDRELAEKIRFKQSTLTAIKNRLKKKGYLTPIRIPQFYKLGCELITISYGNLNPVEPAAKVLTTNRQLTEDAFQQFYAFTEAANIVIFTVAKRYTDSKSAIDHFEYMFSKKKLLSDREFVHLHFPFGTSIVQNFFDFSPLLHQLFNYPSTDMPVLDSVTPGFSARKFTNVEKRIYYGLIKYPDLADNHIAKTIQASRQLVARSRKIFEEEGVLKTTYAPNLKHLGLQILMFVHFKFDIMTDPKRREEGITFVLNNSPLIFFINGSLEACALCAFTDFEDFQQWNIRHLAFFKRTGLLAVKPEILLFSIPGIQMMSEHIYSPFIKRLLDLENVIEEEQEQ